MTLHPRLLLLSCSQRKRQQPGLLPAIERYDGPLFRLLRRYQQGYSATNLGGRSTPSVYIMSAEYGLISADRPIPVYDRRMTTDRARELRTNVLDGLRELLGANTPYRELLLCMGREYQRALEGWGRSWPTGLIVYQAEGSMGGKQAQLYDWLYGAPPSTPTNAYRAAPRIRGIEVDLTPQQVLEVARQALRRDGKNTAHFCTWYVQVDGQPVAPKWLVSQLTGLPVSAFVTDEARRLLAQLGVQVVRA